MDPVWLLAIAVVAAAVVWVIASKRPKSEPAPAAAPKSRSSSSSKDSSKRSSSSSSSSKKEKAAKDPNKLPSMAVDEDDVAITVVTASPESDSRRPVASDADTSTIAVIYEEEAHGEEVTSPIARIIVHAEAETDQGKIRKRNEDSLLVFPERSLFVVADGMGGHVGGAVASALAVETLRSAYERNVFDGKTESTVEVPRRARELACAIQMANHAVLQKAKADPSLKGMGTTVVAARFSPNKQRLYIGHVGDSRCYRMRSGALRQLTTDHTLGQLGVEGPTAEHLFQAVGVGPKVMIDVVIDKPRTDDVYVLCSDGLSKMVTDEEIQQILASEPDIEAAVYSLLELANDHGGKDNVTIIVVKILERVPSGPP